MNRRLRTLVHDTDFKSDCYEKEQLEFGLACIDRIAHLLIDERLISTTECTRQFINDKVSSDTHQKHIQQAKEIAQSHAGTNGIDGAGNAAVSATFALTKALAGDVINGAEYAAYAMIYSYASHTVTDPNAYKVEYEWQVAALQKILHKSNIQSKTKQQS